MDASKNILRLTDLHAKDVETVAGFGRASKTAMGLLVYLEKNPIIEIGKTASALNMSFSTVSLAVRRLTEAGILTKRPGGQRNRTFSYEPYLDILRDGT
jgi:DNA-binding MarR family transcriptional regulator